MSGAYNSRKWKQHTCAGNMQASPTAWSTRTMSRTKFIRVAVEGATSDGRHIERTWLEQMAASYNTATYAARIWLEHLRGTLPDSPFRAFGDVLSLKTEEIEIDGKKKLALLAQLDATPDLVAMNKSRQKLYTSIEVNPNFADTGKAYLMGVAVTDSPASLGTEMLAFNASSTSKPLDGRKLAVGNLFTEATETAIEFEEAEQGGLLAAVRHIFTAQAEKSDAQAQAHTQAAQEWQQQTAAAFALLAQSLDAQAQATAQAFAQLSAALEPLAATASQNAAQAATEAAATTEAAADSAPAAEYTQRTPAAGAAGAAGEGF